MEPLVVDFADGDGSRRDLLGGKGAGLAEMTRIGLRVPPGFVITTEACRMYLDRGELPPGLWEQVEEAVARLEEKSGRTFGGGPAPLLVSVRSGAPISMPGMMDTVLNLGINPDLLPTLIEWSQDPTFAYDAYRRFLQMYADVVLGLPDELFDRILADLRERRGVESDADLTADDLAEVVERFTGVIQERGAKVPDDPMTQLREAIVAVFRSWNNRRAIDYRRIHGIPDDLGTAANVQMMVFGDLGDDSGTGVAFTRDPATGEKKPFGDYLPRAQGEDVVAGIRNTLTLDDLARLLPHVHSELLEVMETLERHTRDMCDIEFTVERGTLWILQTRAGKRTAAAAVKMAVDMVAEGLIDRETAILRVDPASLEQLERPRIGDTTIEPVATGVAASPGAAQGKAVFDSDKAVEWARRGERVLLVRPETTPDDIHGMAAADGILTSQGGKTSHAAVVARGMGKPAVTGASALVVDPAAGRASVDGKVITEGDLVTIDGTTGRVYLGEVPLEEPRPIPELETLLSWADEIRTLGVRANADTPEDAAKARRAGAEGIGLARTEHMFMGERLGIVQRIILTDDPEDRSRALDELKAAQAEDFAGLLEAMDGWPVVVRLLDPPLHEFLPDRLELERRIGELEHQDALGLRSRRDHPVGGRGEDDPRAGPEGDPLGGGQPDAGTPRCPTRVDGRASLPDADRSRGGGAGPP
ncbi:MAG: pyruvate, phosphate dikinase [Acidimicrobiia bacterium]|nr:MAG: pyruvate, phosphate dikinase [Acidimicrobiia bacterium]